MVTIENSDGWQTVILVEKGTDVRVGDRFEFKLATAAKISKTTAGPKAPNNPY